MSSYVLNVSFPVYFLFLLDNSGSMSGDKISQLNSAMDRVIPQMRSLGTRNPMFPIHLGAIYFNSTVGWHISPTNVNNVWWKPLQTTGTTNMSGAIRLASDMINSKIGGLGVPPIIVLLSDGFPDGGSMDNSPFYTELSRFSNTPWGKLAQRRSIAVGSDCDRSVMRMFARGNPDFVIRVDDAANQLPQEIERLAVAILSETLEYSSIQR